jgi:DNA-binding protein HU-beta
MTKAELIEKMAKDAKINKAEAARAFESLVNNVTQTLKSGKKVAITGLGVFSVRERKARTARNPKTGETIQVPAKKVVRFRASSELRKW